MFRPTLIHLRSLPLLPVLGVAIVLFSLAIFNPCRGQTDSSLSLDLSATNAFKDVVAPAPAPLRENVPTDGPAQSFSKFQDIRLLEKQGYYDEALRKADGEVLANPRDVYIYLLRGHIYSEISDWDKADADFQSILKIDPDNFLAKFNRSEVSFERKNYDAARSGFFALEKNSDFGDLAAYKVFVCDLFAGHEDVAQGELAVFTADGSHASYYYANATWSFFHKHPEKAQSWVDSAKGIFPAQTNFLYSSTLVDNGYLPASSSDPNR